MIYLYDKYITIRITQATDEPTFYVKTTTEINMTNLTKEQKQELLKSVSSLSNLLFDKERRLKKITKENDKIIIEFKGDEKNE